MGTADTVEGFTRWYARLLRTVVHIEVKDDSFILFHRALQTVYRLDRLHSAGAEPKVSDWLSRATRHATSVLSDRLKRSIATRQVAPSKRRPGASSSGSSPRVKLNLSQSSVTSSGSSHQRVEDAASQKSGGAQFSVKFVPPPSDDGSDSPASQTRLSVVGSNNRAFDQKLRQAVWLLGEEFPSTSELLQGVL